MKTFLKLTISIGLLVLAVSLLDVRTIKEMLQQVSVETFIAAIAINILVFSIMGVRWYRLAITKIDSSLWNQLAVYFKATFLNTFTPANLGSDTYRLVVLKGGSATSGALFQLLLRERLLGLYGYVIIFAFAYTFITLGAGGGGLSANNPYIYGVAVALAVFMLPFLLRHLGVRTAVWLCVIIGGDRLPRLEAWMETLAGLLSLRGVLWLMSLTFLGILLWVVSIQVVAGEFGLGVPLLQLAVVATLVELIRLLPVTVQGIGLREGAFAYLLSFFGHNPEQCYVVGLVAYLALSLSIVLCGPIGQLMGWMNASKEQR